LSFSQNNLCRGSQFTRLVFDELPLDFKFDAVGLFVVFNNAIYNIEDFAANTSY